jgi:hypothetical protein
MRLYSSALAAVSLMVFAGADGDRDRSRLLHVEVMPMLSAEACPIAAWLAERYLVPAVAGGERLVWICHQSLRRRDFEAMRAEAAAHNAAVAEGPHAAGR